MKQRDFKRCLLCKRGVMHASNISFFRMKIERLGIRADAVRRAHGLEMMIGGLAQVMGPDEDLTVSLSSPPEFLICEPCSLDLNKAQPLFCLLEAASEAEGAKAEGAR